VILHISQTLGLENFLSVLVEEYLGGSDKPEGLLLFFTINELLFFNESGNSILNGIMDFYWY